MNSSLFALPVAILAFSASAAFASPGTAVPGVLVNPLPVEDSIITEPTVNGLRIAFGPEGQIHVIYTTSDGLVYARKNMWTGQWTEEVVAPQPVGGQDIAVGPDGQPQISFNGSASFGNWGSLYHARKESTGWILTLVDASRLYGYSTSIAVDQAGGAHILAKEEQDGPLWYFEPIGLGWQGEIVDADSNPGRYSCLRLDSSGTPQAAYSTWSPKTAPRYAIRIATGNWSVTTLDQDTDTYRQVWLAIDSNDLPHVTYHDGDHGLYYAVNDGVGWTTTKLSGINGKYACLQLDSKDQYHIISPNDDGFVYYLSRGRVAKVANGSLNGRALALDIYDRPHIVFGDMGEGVLRTR